MTEVQWTDRFIAAAAFAAVLSFGGMYVWAQGGNGGDGGINAREPTIVNRDNDPFTHPQPPAHGRWIDPTTGNVYQDGKLVSDPSGNGENGGALDSHGQVTGGGTGSVNGGLTAGGPR